MKNTRLSEVKILLIIIMNSINNKNYSEPLSGREYAYFCYSSSAVASRLDVQRPKRMVSFKNNVIALFHW